MLSARTLAGAALAGACLLVQSQPARALAYSPAYTTTGSIGGFTGSSTTSSFGFYFDTNSNVDIGALGFSAQSSWGNGTSYVVKLWSFANEGVSPSEYIQLASATFTEGNTYDLQHNYYWSPIPVVTLPDSDSSDPGGLNGYVIAAIGNFSNSIGNVQYEAGIPVFNSPFLITGNAYNDENDPDGFFEIPIYDGGIDNNGYFNANLAAVSSPPAPVPGPLAFGGGVAAFAWSRRLRHRVNASSTH